MSDELGIFPDKAVIHLAHIYIDVLAHALCSVSSWVEAHAGCHHLHLGIQFQTPECNIFMVCCWILHVVRLLEFMQIEALSVAPIFKIRSEAQQFVLLFEWQPPDKNEVECC